MLIWRRHLRNNRLTSLPLGVFDSLTKLDTLLGLKFSLKQSHCFRYLTSNFLTNLQSLVFFKLVALQRLFVVFIGLAFSIHKPISDASLNNLTAIEDVFVTMDDLGAMYVQIFLAFFHL
jgi:hypothetical protein